MTACKGNFNIGRFSSKRLNTTPMIQLTSILFGRWLRAEFSLFAHIEIEKKNTKRLTTQPTYILSHLALVSQTQLAMVTAHSAAQLRVKEWGSHILELWITTSEIGAPVATVSKPGKNQNDSPRLHPSCAVLTHTKLSGFVPPMC